MARVWHRDRRGLGVALIAVTAVGLAVVLSAPAPRHAPGAAPAPADAQPVVVQEVLTGDRLVVRVDAPGAQWQTWGTITVRLAGVQVGENTPFCHAVVARDHLASLAPPGSVVWAVHEPQRDADGAWPVWLWAPRSDLLAAVLAQSGDVRPIAAEMSSRYVGVITQSVDRAVAGGLGQWGACP